jgi:adenine-specific DNA-methyltransferase
MANETARRLRKQMTTSEWRLWLALRNRQLDGYRFRRQHPIGPFVVDFVCLQGRLVIEVDGTVHDHLAVFSRDHERQVWLESRGFSVLRVTDTDVMQDDLARVLAKIRAALE